MSRSATTSASKLSGQLPSKSAWSKGPPQTASAPSPRSHSPAPSVQPQISHSRRSSVLEQGVSFKDGVSVPRNNVRVVKQGTAVTFGSIDDASAPLSISPLTKSPVKSEEVKPLGTVSNTHVNEKTSVASRPAAGSSIATPLTSTPSASASTPSIPAVPASTIRGGWPAHIVAKSSRLLDTETIESKFYGLYNNILNECFPPTQFTVIPQYTTSEAQMGGIGAIHFAITYVIESLNLESPVFFIEIKPPIQLSSLYARKAAQGQIRTRFEQLAELVQIPKLYGVSAMGRQLSYYTYERASGAIEPVPLAESTEVIVDTVPIDRWDTNIMQEEGHTKFVAMVEEIKQIVRDL